MLLYLDVVQTIELLARPSHSRENVFFCSILSAPYAHYQGKQIFKVLISLASLPLLVGAVYAVNSDIHVNGKTAFANNSAGLLAGDCCAV